MEALDLTWLKEVEKEKDKLVGGIYNPKITTLKKVHKQSDLRIQQDVEYLVKGVIEDSSYTKFEKSVIGNCCYYFEIDGLKFERIREDKKEMLFNELKNKIINSKFNIHFLKNIFNKNIFETKQRLTLITQGKKMEEYIFLDEKEIQENINFLKEEVIQLIENVLLKNNQRELYEKKSNELLNYSIKFLNDHLKMLLINKDRLNSKSFKGKNKEELIEIFKKISLEEKVNERIYYLLLKNNINEYDQNYEPNIYDLNKYMYYLNHEQKEEILKRYIYTRKSRFEKILNLSVNKKDKYKRLTDFKSQTLSTYNRINELINTELQ